MSRLSVRAGSALALIVALVTALPARADDSTHLWFSGTRLIFERAAQSGSDIAVATGDAGLARFLGRVGATLSWDTAQRNIVLVSADRRVIRFTLGDLHYGEAGSVQAAAFAPYLANGEAFLPFYAIARALGVEPVRSDGEIVLQPQLFALDIKSAAKSTIVTMRAATAIRFKKIDDSEKLIVMVQGVSSALDPTREINAAGLSDVTVVAGGTAKAPSATFTFTSPPGTTRAMLASASPNAIVLVFGAPGTTAGGTPIPDTFAATPFVAGTPVTITGGTVANPRILAPTAPRVALTPAPVAPAQQTALSPPGGGIPPPATISLIDEAAIGDGLAVRIIVAGGASFEWHRLIDNRFYVDVKNATLGFPAREDAPPSGVVPSVRIKQLTTSPIPIVRIALTLTAPRQIDVVNTENGIAIAIGSNEDPDPSRVGAGEINGGLAYSQPTVSTLPLPAMLRGALNPRLIVIDPGHGGSDYGAMHNNLIEKILTLDISKRLRDILLARGWQVKMTRDTDVDVFAPNDSARDELQARCDAANAAGARLFVSVHINSSTSSSVNGTTSYYYKPTDLSLATSIQRRLMATLGTADMGVRKEAFYVIKHTSMPATLVETAFISNPSDAARMRSPDFLQRVAASIADGIADFTASGATAGFSQ